MRTKTSYRNLHTLRLPQALLVHVGEIEAYCVLHYSELKNRGVMV
jgi:hypothetical protein